MFQFRQFLSQSLNEASQSSSHYLMRKHGWELAKTQDVGSHAVKYTHPKLPNHEIHLSKNNFIHQDKSRDKDIAFGSHDDLHTHLKSLHEDVKIHATEFPSEWSLDKKNHDTVISAWDKNHKKGLEPKYANSPKKAMEAEKNAQIPKGYAKHNMIGHALIRHGTNFSVDTYVHPDHRRKGVATKMYNHYHSITGKKLEPGMLTGDGKSFRKSYDKISEEFEKIISTNDINASDVYKPNKVDESININHELVKPSHDILMKHGFEFTGKSHSKKEGKFHQFNYQKNGLKVKTFVHPEGAPEQKIQHHVNNQWVHHSGLSNAIQKNECVGDPADFRLTAKTWGDSYNPVPMDDADDTDNDKQQIANGDCINDRSANDLGPGNTKGMGISNEGKTPNDYAPNDYSPRVAPGMSVMPEGFADPSSHPFHSVAIKSGFSHTGSSSMLGAATHTYSHPKSQSPLQLKTSSNGSASWQHGSVTGNNAMSLNFHAGNLHESIKMINHKDHPLHATLSSMGFEKASTAHTPHTGTQHLYVHKNAKIPTVTLHSPGDGYTINTQKPTKGGGVNSLRKSLGKHLIDEGILSSIFKSKPAPSDTKITLPYKTDHDYGRGYDIEPSSVPVFKPSWQSKGSSNTQKED